VIRCRAATACILLSLISLPGVLFAGDWSGLRDSLRDAGVDISLNYTTDISGNPAGGLDRTVVYSGFLSLSTVLDLEKILSIDGLSLKIGNYLASGRDISVSIGSYYSPQQVYTSGDYYFGVLDLSKSMFDDKLDLEAGRLFAGDVFAVSPMFQYYLTSAVDGRLAAIPSDIFFPHYRSTAWGARATFRPETDWSFITGIYNADPSVADPGKNGLDFSFRTDKGYLAVGQVNYRKGQEKESPEAPGGISFGGYYESSSFAYLSDPDVRVRGNYGFYATADKMIYRADLHRGLSVWGAGMYAPRDEINPQTYQAAAGLIYQGLPPGRSNDVTAFCFVLGHFSNDMEGRSEEMIIELDHRFQLTPWCYVTPDLQYIIKPNGMADIDNALVLGFEASFDF